MGATLACRSTLGVGSVFSLSLPVVTGSPATPEVAEADPAAGPGAGPALPRPRLVPPWEPLRATPGA